MADQVYEYENDFYPDRDGKFFHLAHSEPECAVSFPTREEAERFLAQNPPEMCKKSHSGKRWVIIPKK